MNFDSCRPSRLRHHAERAPQIFDEKRKGSAQARATSDHDHIGAALAMVNCGRLDRVAQASADAIALGRVSDLLRDGQSEAQAGHVVPEAPLHRHPLRMEAAARSRRQEFGSFGQPPRPWNGRRLRAPVAHSRRECLRGEPLAALRPARGDDLAAALGGHAGAKAVPALADELARLIGPLHGSSPAARQAEGCARDCLTDCSGKNDERPEGAPPRGAHMAEQAAEVNVSQQRGRGA